ncbi:MAG TPA: ATP-binding protein [Bacteriovoracaceae bacterium]|nr:ATP-binding protein [Bacteriovoracaceae bacterium]
MIRASVPIEGIYDRFRIEQVITNLFTNAIKYGDNKEVIIDIEKQDSKIKVHFRDHGLGIAEENQSRIFDRFERVNNSEVKIKGLGLGLYITKQIIEAHQGHIRVQSKLGIGSTFTVELPLHFIN